MGTGGTVHGYSKEVEYKPNKSSKFSILFSDQISHVYLMIA